MCFQSIDDILWYIIHKGAICCPTVMLSFVLDSEASNSPTTIATRYVLMMGVSAKRTSLKLPSTLSCVTVEYCKAFLVQSSSFCKNMSYKLVNLHQCVHTPIGFHSFAMTARSASPPPSLESLSSGMFEWTVRSLGATNEMEKRA